MFLIELAVIAAAAALTALLCFVMRPWLVRHALARPNARSLHTAPTPQGGGFAIALAMGLTLAGAAFPLGLTGAEARLILIVGASAGGLALIGAVDDIRPIPSLPRLALHLLLVWFALGALPDEARIFPALLPSWAERALLVLALAWFANLVNFMDGMDWMCVVEFVPLCGALLALAQLGLLPADAALLTTALLGGLIGFAPYNAPVARLFLGDVGSLPMGLITGFALILVAARGYLAAALLLPLYFVADATLTLFARIKRGERVWEAHRTHFYQRAVARGFSVRGVLAHVFALNCGLTALAFVSVAWSGFAAQAACLAAGVAATGLVLRRFRAPR